MIRIESDIWDNLVKASPEGGNLSARLAFPGIANRLYAAIDVEKRRHLLVLLNPEDSILLDTQSRGLKVNTRELKILGKESSRYIDIECCDPSGHDAFDLIGGEIVGGLSSVDSVPSDIVTHVLAKWRRFWGQMQRQLMTREEQLGLFAELWFLINWLLPTIGHKAAFERWRGPFGARNDFEWTGCSVEVKATTSHRGLIHHINGLEQLEDSAEGRLLLFSMQLREEGGASLTLPALIKKCKQLLIADPDVLSMFESGLVQVGYSLAHEDEYAKMRLRIIQEALFRVEADFPRIITGVFSAGVPVGVEKVEYEINLSAFSHLILAKKIEDSAEILK